MMSFEPKCQDNRTEAEGKPMLNTEECRPGDCDRCSHNPYYREKLLKYADRYGLWTNPKTGLRSIRVR